MHSLTGLLIEFTCSPISVFGSPLFKRSFIFLHISLALCKCFAPTACFVCSLTFECSSIYDCSNFLIVCFIICFTHFCVYLPFCTHSPFAPVLCNKLTLLLHPISVVWFVTSNIHRITYRSKEVILMCFFSLVYMSSKLKLNPFSPLLVSGNKGYLQVGFSHDFFKQQVNFPF